MLNSQLLDTLANMNSASLFFVFILSFQKMWINGKQSHCDYRHLATLETIINTDASAPSSDLFFLLNGTVYQPGETVLITDIGAFVDVSNAGSSLVCVTTNVNSKCCRTSDGGNMGEWFFPNGTIVPRNSGNEHRNFTRSGFTQQARLNRRNNAMVPLGAYTCVVPNEGNTINHTASIIISEQEKKHL